jgi:hypothetical protein
MAHEKFTEQELEQKAEDIMRSFNFESVLKHMQDTDWKWYVGGGVMGVPDMQILRATARNLLVRAIYDKAEVANVGTGGFTAYKLPWGMQLTFQLENTHA